MRPTILLVEDDPDAREMLQETLVRAHYAVRACGSGAEAIGLLEADDAPDVDVVVSDFSMDDMDGIEVGRWVAENRGIPTILLTGRGSMDVVIEALRAGIHDFQRKPIEPQVLVHAVERAARYRALEVELARLRDLDQPRAEAGIIGESPAMKATLDLVRRVAGADISVLITGETGTGKELVARALHDQSARKAGPFVAVNCAAIPESLLESELFGHVKGAFTDAAHEKKGLFLEATGGTLFLDEVGEMPTGMQAKLLRSLQEQTVRPVGGHREIPFDARVVAATNKDLEEQVEAGAFREDLYYRLNVVHIALPPLRARGMDVLLLADHFVKAGARKLERPLKGIAESAASLILRYDWPGNVRELESAMQRAVAVTRTDRIVAEDLPERVQRAPAKVLPDDAPAETLPSMDSVERTHIERVLAATGGNKTRASRILGFDRRTLYRKLARYGLEEDGGAAEAGST